MSEAKILGLATMGDSAAAVSVGGRIVAAIEEERISRRKYDGAFPYGAVGECLRIAGLSMADLDQICVYWQPWRIWTRAARVAARTLTRANGAGAMLARVGAIFTSRGHDTDADYPQLAGRWDDLFRIRRLLGDHFGSFDARVAFIDHHLCHAVSGRVLVPQGDALCLTIDGGGEDHSTVVGCFEGDRFRVLKRIRWPKSLGHFYSTMTGYLGFRIRDGEYKMMGLASFGRPVHAGVIRERLLTPADGGEYRLNARLVDYHAALQGRFPSGLIELLGPPRAHGEPVTDRHREIAASAQAAFEAAVFDLVHWAKRQRPQVRQLILAGGCALNATANGKIVDSGLFERVVVPPAPHDAGCAIGAALVGDLRTVGGSFERTMPMPTAYLGSAFTDSDIAQSFSCLGLPLPSRLAPDALIAAAADALVAGEVIAWFQGASEFGPRALGNRSFLADPRSDQMRERINAKIKHREPFRPFAPSVKAERAGEFFAMRQPSPFMNIVSQVRPEKVGSLGAVTHVDGSARVHTVTREANERYWQLLDAFEARTGVPVLLNTSFNIQEPIVNTPAEAIATFHASGADKLFIGDRVCDDEWRSRAASARSG